MSFVKKIYFFTNPNIIKNNNSNIYDKKKLNRDCLNRGKKHTVYVFPGKPNNSTFWLQKLEEANKYERWWVTLF